MCNWSRASDRDFFFPRILGFFHVNLMHLLLLHFYMVSEPYDLRHRRLPATPLFVCHRHMPLAQSPSSCVVVIRLSRVASAGLLWHPYQLPGSCWIWWYSVAPESPAIWSGHCSALQCFLELSVFLLWMLCCYLCSAAL